MNVFKLLVIGFLLSSCGNSVEEVKNPKTGMLQIRYEYYNDDSGQKVNDGFYREWNDDGSIHLEQFYKDGLLDGIEIRYETKDSIMRSNYKNDKLEGITSIEVNSKVLCELNYKSGEPQGKQTWYHPNGKPSSIGFANSQGFIRDWKAFDSKGNSIAQFHLNENGGIKELIGKWVEQTTDGKEYFYIFFEDGTYEYWAPLLQISRKAIKQFGGGYAFTDNMILRQNFGENVFRIITFDGERLVLDSKYGVEEYLRE